MAGSFHKTILLLKRAGLLVGDSDVAERCDTGHYSPIHCLAMSGLVNEVACLKYLAAAQGTKYVDLSATVIANKIVVSQFVPQLSEAVCWEHKVIPLWLEDTTAAEDQVSVVVAFADILDYETQKTIEFSLGRNIIPVAAEEEKIEKLLQQYLPKKQIAYDQLSNTSHEALEIIGGQRDEQNLDQVRTDMPPIIKLVNKIIADAVKKEASDIHIEPTTNGLNVRFRIDGVLQDILDIPRRLQPLVVSRLKILAGMDIAERRKPQDGRLRVSMANNKIDVRASSVPTAHGEKIVLRLLRAEGEDVSFDTLHFPAEIKNMLQGVLAQRGKIVLVTGPTGSGKTTTLYSCLMHLRNGLSSIQTVEDPIEFRIPGITQVQVNPLTGVTFASALRSILRQDPDIIMIGEIRDQETADIAIQAAQTGHLVLSTLHTNDAPSAITRLINLGCKPYLIANSVSAVMAQRLVRKICPDCKARVNDDYLDKHQALLNQLNIDGHLLYHGVGCPMCNGTGYKGRLGLYSFLPVNKEVAEAIYQEADLDLIATKAAKAGYHSLAYAARQMLCAEVSTIEELQPYLVVENDSEEHLLQGTGQQQRGAAGAEKQAMLEKLNKPKLLLVDDDDNIRTVLSILLKREMFEVIEARNGSEALEKVYEDIPQIILLDLMMPQMDGREFLVRARAIEGLKNVPVVVLTAVDNEQNEVELLNLGAQDFVSKTASSGVIATRVRNALRK